MTLGGGEKITTSIPSSLSLTRILARILENEQIRNSTYLSGEIFILEVAFPRYKKKTSVEASLPILCVAKDRHLTNLTYTSNKIRSKWL